MHLCRIFHCNKVELIYGSFLSFFYIHRQLNILKTSSIVSGNLLSQCLIQCFSKKTFFFEEQWKFLKNFLYFFVFLINFNLLEKSEHWSNYKVSTIFMWLSILKKQINALINSGITRFYCQIRAESISYYNMVFKDN